MQTQIIEFMHYLKVQKNCSEKTLLGYRNDLEQFMNELHISSIEEISKSNIRQFLAMLCEQGAKPATRNRKLSSLRSFCQYLCGEEYLDKNPAIGIPYATIGTRLPMVMTQEKTSQVIDSAFRARDKAILETLYGTACRVEELVNIKINDIDFTSALIRIIGKGNKERIIPMSVSAVVAIQQYLNERDILSEYVFPSANPEKPLTTRTMYNVARKYGLTNGVQISPHKFRHSLATHLLENGTDIRSIQLLLGHENINTTTIYTQLAIGNMARQFHSAHPRG